MIRSLAIVALAVGFFAARRPAHADDFTDAKAFISKQVDLIKAGKLDDVKPTFSRRQQERITQEAIDKAKTQADKYPIDELVASAAKTSDGIKIKMKNGRTLTTLIKEDGVWKADTVWFK